MDRLLFDEYRILLAENFLTWLSPLMSVLTKDMRYSESIADNSFETEGTNMCEVLDRIVAQGEARGEAIGIEKNRTEMIHNMLKENISVEVIARVAKLTVEQVIAISKKVAVL